MNFDELINYVQSVPENIKEHVPDMIAETAVKHYKKTFSDKAWDGKAWAPRKDNRPNSLMIDSSNLVNSIRPAYIGPDKVTVSAGSAQVPYAKPHNEGFKGTVQIPESWRITRRGEKTKVSAHSKQMNLPQRQFLGYNEKLGDEIVQGIKDIQDTLLPNK